MLLSSLFKGKQISIRLRALEGCVTAVCPSTRKAPGECECAQVCVCARAELGHAVCFWQCFHLQMEAEQDAALGILIWALLLQGGEPSLFRSHNSCGQSMTAMP